MPRSPNQRKADALLVGIFGAGRNGSTLLMRLLDGSPELWVYPSELNYLSAFGTRRFRWSATRTKQFCDWAESQLRELKQTYLRNLVQPITVNEEPLRLFAKRNEFSVRDNLFAFLDAIRSAFDDRPPSAASPLLVFKSIEVNAIPKYLKLFPEMRCIHLIRHPFSNYASLKRTDMISKQKPFWFQGGDLLKTQLERRWVPHARFIVEECRPGSLQHLLVRYEDVCEMPDVTVSNICRWLGVTPPSDPSLQTVWGGKTMIELPPNPSKKGIRTEPRVIPDMAQKFGYEDVLTERERQFISFRTERLAHQLGYCDIKLNPTLAERLKMMREWILPDKWELMNANSSPRLMKEILRRRIYIFSRLATRLG